jgi:hypothetical protein
MIDIRIQDENGTVETEFADSEILHVLLEKAPVDSKCLQFIDPYGGTTFNRYQAEVLAVEIEAAADSLKDSREQERAAALVTFVRHAATMVHTYIKFVGD